ncbi:MAG TPA: DUF5668 domain-containing protein [Candidatus Limnocylindria bacterium]|nr:DUF5668 domain-containing protein [Candidatus Limnocylindria bacterium]
MKNRKQERSRPRSIFFGLFLIAIGTAFLLDRFGVLNVPSLGRLWPGFVIGLGLVHVLEGRIGSGMMFVVFGTWFFACEYAWLGLTFRNSWPLLIVALGLSMILESLVRSRRNTEISEGGAQ